jgi:hypothetical protein
MASNFCLVPEPREQGGGDLMKIVQTAAVIPADSIVKGG